jgi:hypothetical protein
LSKIDADAVCRIALQRTRQGLPIRALTLWRKLTRFLEYPELFSNRTLEATAAKPADGKYDVTIHVEARKFKADAKGNETEVPVDDWIDIGAFAKPASGKKYGDTLYRERIHITRQDATFTFTTAQLPEKAGIDPFALLIDRIPDDNVKNVILEFIAGTASTGSVEKIAKLHRKLAPC